MLRVNAVRAYAMRKEVGRFGEINVSQASSFLKHTLVYLAEQDPYDVLALLRRYR